MPETKKPNDTWADSILSLLNSEGDNLSKLAESAGLDPYSGELECIDLSGLDLTGQNLSGWKLGSACLKHTVLTGADLSGAEVDPISVSQSTDWENASIDDDTRDRVSDATLLSKLLIEVADLGLSVRNENVLKNMDIQFVGQLVQLTEAEWLRTPNTGRKSMNQLKELFAGLGLHFGMDVSNAINKKYFGG